MCAPNRKRTKVDHFFQDRRWWLAILATVTLITLCVFAVRKDMKMKVVEKSLSTGEAWEIRPDGTRAPLDPKDSESHHMYKIP